MPNEPLRCRHIHTEGRQCGSPALRGEKLCYHHHALRRPLARRTGTELIRPHLPHPEDLQAVQNGIAELLRLISMGHEDGKTHKLLLGTLTLASANLARIERNRRAARELELRERALARSEARFAAKHPQSRCSGGHSPRESASGPATDSTPEPGCPTFGAVSPRRRWDSTSEPPVTDLVHDPELGTIAPGPDPEPRPEARVPDPTPLLTPAPPMPTSEENLARWNRAIAKLQHTINLDAAASPEPDPEPDPAGCPTFATVSSSLRWDEGTDEPPANPGSLRNSFRMLDHTPKTTKRTGPTASSHKRATNPRRSTQPQHRFTSNHQTAAPLYATPPKRGTNPHPKGRRPDTYA